MDYFNKTEEQEFNDVKEWFKKNGTAILLVLVVISGSVFGWNFWKNHQLQSAQETSATYQQVFESYLQDPAKNAPLVEKFIAENQGSAYATFAQLGLAKEQVVAGDFAKAKAALQTALANTSDATLQNLIRMRLAAVDFQLQNFDEALTTLGQVKDKAWELRKQVLTGDILVAKGDKAAAKSAYEQAKANAEAEQDKAQIEARLNNL
ncbi:hypothetical protein A4G20_09650 [Pasteurellaceae bacterium RH1A]|nr:hypothetical protein A4G20_09650 [Pasteurellaceae bacterium RH1A]